MKQKKEIRLEDIAKELNISTVTVSNALSGRKGVSDSLRSTVVRMAKELGYDVSRYHERKREEGIRFGVLLSEEYFNMACSFQWILYQQIVYAASKKDISVFLKIVEEKKGINGINLEEWDSSVDGLMIISKVKSKEIEELLRSMNVPVILLDVLESMSDDSKYSTYVKERIEFIQESMPVCDLVRQNPYMGVCRTVRYLLERGHENIAFVAPADSRDYMQEHYLGFCRGMGEYGKAVREEWIIKNDMVLKDGIYTEQIVLPKIMPTAFVCIGFHTAGLLYEELLRKGFQIPEDVSLIAYDHLYAACSSGYAFLKQLTSCSPDIRLIAMTAVDILLRRKDNPDMDYGTIYAGDKIIEGKSVKDIKALRP